MVNPEVVNQGDFDMEIEMEIESQESSMVPKPVADDLVSSFQSFSLNDTTTGKIDFNQTYIIERSDDFQVRFRVFILISPSICIKEVY